MFVINKDSSIYVTRGDIVYFTVRAKQNDVPYVFKSGDVLRMKIFAKKDCKDVVLRKDFTVEAEAESVVLHLSGKETKIGSIISKPTVYWYEVELNPETYPQTIIGYDEEGPRVFMLFPEGRDMNGDDLEEGDIPWVDPELDTDSSNPIQNQATAKEFEKVWSALNNKLSKTGGTMIGVIEMGGNKISGLADPAHDGDAVNLRYAKQLFSSTLTEESVEAIVQQLLSEENTKVIVQEIIREENMETIIHEILKEENTEVIVQEIIKEENIGTIVNEIIKENNLQTIVNEILKEENTEVIVQEILKEENTQIIVEQVLEEIPGHLVVKLDGSKSSHSATEINEHISKGGSVVLDVSGNDWQATYATLWYALPASVVFSEVSVNEGIIYQTLYIINDTKVCTEETKEFECSGGGSGGTDTKKPVQKVTVTKNGTIVNVFFKYTDGTGATALITVDENDTPLTITENGNTTTFEWSGL